MGNGFKRVRSRSRISVKGPLPSLIDDGIWDYMAAKEAEKWVELNMSRKRDNRICYGKDVP